MQAGLLAILQRSYAASARFLVADYFMDCWKQKKNIWEASQKTLAGDVFVPIGSAFDIFNKEWVVWKHTLYEVDDMTLKSRR